MTKYISINGIKREMTAEEEAKFDQDTINSTAVREQKDTEDADRASKRTSGKAKLKAGEALTDAEISALFGD